MLWQSVHDSFQVIKVAIFIVYHLIRFASNFIILGVGLVGFPDLIFNGVEWLFHGVKLLLSVEKVE